MDGISDINGDRITDSGERYPAFRIREEMIEIREEEDETEDRPEQEGTGGGTDEKEAESPAET